MPRLKQVDYCQTQINYCRLMDTWGAAAWGLTGGLCVEALALYSLIRGSRRWSWRRPIPQGLVAYVISVVLRVGAGAGLAAAASGSRQVSGTLATGYNETALAGM